VGKTLRGHHSARDLVSGAMPPFSAMLIRPAVPPSSIICAPWSRVTSLMFCIAVTVPFASA
jgi:hypothetical protein